MVDIPDLHDFYDGFLLSHDERAYGLDDVGIELLLDEKSQRRRARAASCHRAKEGWR